MTKYKRSKGISPNNKAIFIVDDDISYLYPLVYYLQKNTKFDIRCFTNGEDCIHSIGAKPRLVILDFNLNPQLPNTMNGLEVLQKIKNLSPETKVIILSGRDAYQGVVDSLKSGAYTYVLKDTEAISAIKNIISILVNDGDKGSITGIA